MSGYRFITPTDVDRFIQIPDTLDVDARTIVLTVDEDTMFKYDKLFKIMDYVIYCEAPKSTFFNTSMDWKYKIIQKYDSSNNYMGPKVIDAHDPLSDGLPLTTDIINATATKDQLGVLTSATRFAHYKQCNRFFKYSFKVGDSVSVSVLNSDNTPVLDGDSNPVTRSAQLFAVYLNTTTGESLPYWSTVSGNGTDQTAEERVFYYADDTELGTTLTTLAAGSQVTSTLDGAAAAVTVLAPPDPEFIESDNAVVGGNIVYSKDGEGDLVIRPVGPSDTPIVYASNQFVRYTTDTGRELMLYWVVQPVSGKAYLGEELYVAWSSRVAGDASGNLRPIRDIRDASFNYVPATALNVREAHKFTFSKNIPAATPRDILESVKAVDAVQQSETSCPRMYLPASKFIVLHEKPTEPDVHNNGQEEFDVPFSHEVANGTDFDDVKKSIMGGRVMQLISQYLFDKASNTELGYFPFMLNESKALTDKIIDSLASLVKTVDSNTYNSRSEILSQMMVKHGRKYFEEYAVFNETTGESTGSVWDVISKLNEMFLYFTVTIRTTVSNRTKDDVDVIRLVQVPMVVRVYDA